MYTIYLSTYFDAICQQKLVENIKFFLIYLDFLDTDLELRDMKIS